MNEEQKQGKIKKLDELIQSLLQGWQDYQNQTYRNGVLDSIPGISFKKDEPATLTEVPTEQIETTEKRRKQHCKEMLKIAKRALKVCNELLAQTADLNAKEKKLTSHSFTNLTWHVSFWSELLKQ